MDNASGREINATGRRTGRTALAVGLPAALLCMLIGTLAGAGGYTVYYAQGLSYLSNDPRSCVNCHIMREQYDGWQKASHHGFATCNDCHVPHDFLGKYLAKAGNGYWHSKGFTLQDFHEPIRIKPSNAAILQDNCLRCHGEMVSEILVHQGAEAGVWNCIHCHVTVGHGPAR